MELLDVMHSWASTLVVLEDMRRRGFPVSRPLLNIRKSEGPTLFLKIGSGGALQV